MRQNLIHSEPRNFTVLLKKIQLCILSVICLEITGSKCKHVSFGGEGLSSLATDQRAHLGHYSEGLVTWPWHHRFVKLMKL